MSAWRRRAWPLRLAVRALRHNALRSWICAWTIAAAVCAILVTRGLTVVQAERASAIFSRIESNYLVAFDSFSTTLEAASFDRLARPLADAGIAHRHDLLCAIFVEETDPIPFQLCGVSTPRPAEFDDIVTLDAGRFAADGALEVIVERNLADRWKLRPGDSLKVFAKQPALRVTGTFVRRSQMATPDLFTSLGVVQKLRDRDGELTLALLALAPGADIDTAEKAVQALLPDTRIVRPAALRARIESAARPVAVGAALHSGFVCVLCGMICVFAIWSSVHERRDELAVLRALGYPRRTLLGMVLSEGLLIGSVGAFKGALLGHTFLVAILPRLHPGLGGSTGAGEIALATSLGIALATLGALAPGLRASAAAPQELLA